MNRLDPYMFKTATGKVDWAAYNKEVNKWRLKMVSMFQLEDTREWDHCPEGWHDIVEQAFRDMRAAGWDGEILQVKSKFGALTIYVGASSDAVRQIIRAAEVAASKTCPSCGAHATAITQGTCVACAPSE